MKLTKTPVLGCYEIVSLKRKKKKCQTKMHDSVTSDDANQNLAAAEPVVKSLVTVQNGLHHNINSWH